MQEVVVGGLAVVVGLILTLRGYVAMRVALTLVGAFAGFLLGAGIVAELTHRVLLHHALGWVAGLVGAAVLGSLTYLWYQVSVVIGMAGIGFSLGVGAMGVLGFRSGWLVPVVGVAAGVLLAIIAMAGDLPAVLLVVVTALAGASLVVQGAMLLAGGAVGRDLGNLTGGGHVNPWWIALYVVLVVIGLVAQSRHLARARHTMHQAWQGAPG